MENKIMKFAVMIIISFSIYAHLESADLNSNKKALDSELKQLILTHGKNYVEMRDKLLKEHNFKNINPDDYKIPAYRLAIKILKSRSLNLNCFKKFDLKVSTLLKKSKKKKIDYYGDWLANKIEISLYKYCIYPNKIPNYRMDMSAINGLIDPYCSGEITEEQLIKKTNEIAKKDRIRNNREKQESERLNKPDRPDAEVAVLEYIWKLPQYMSKKTSKHPHIMTRVQLSGILEFLTQIINKEPRCRFKGLDVFIKETGGKDNIAWIIIDYLYNFRGIGYFDITRAQHKNKTQCMAMLIDGLRTLKYYGVVSILEEIKNEYLQSGKLDNEETKQVEILEKAIKEFKSKKVPDIQWKGLLVKWAPTPKKQTAKPTDNKQKEEEKSTSTCDDKDDQLKTNNDEENDNDEDYDVDKMMEEYLKLFNGEGED